MKVTYYLEVVSSWCYWAEPAWAELKQRYAGRVAFDWKIALMSPADFPRSREQCDWYYRRSGTVVGSPRMLRSDWLEPELAGNYLAPNLVAEAARDLGIAGDKARLAIARAGLLEGHQVGRIAEAAAAVTAATGLPAESLLERAVSDEVEARVRASTAAFHALGVSQRPAFLIESASGDRVVFSGIWRAGPLAAALDDMLADAAAYQSYAAHFGRPPAG
jgi:predicted DsbA family dithiol-disulfide isomerase